MNKPTHHLPVTIESQRGDSLEKKGITFKNIPCRIYLPQERYEQVFIYLDLTDGQTEVISRYAHLFWKMSLSGWLRQGSTLYQIKASECYVKNNHRLMRGYGYSFQIIELPLEVWDLQITRIEEIDQDGIVFTPFGKSNIAKKPKKLPPIRDKEALVVFWLTHNQILESYRTQETSFTGEIKMEAGDPLAFKISEDLEIKFLIYYRWDDDSNPQKLNRIEDMVVEARVFDTGKIKSEYISLLDNFLLLVSLASRWSTICLGWDTFQSPYTIQNYRHGMILPMYLRETRRPIKQDIDKLLVSKSDAKEFLDSSWTRWQKMPPPKRELIRQVLLSVIHAQTLDLEASFIALYASLEKIVLEFRQRADLEFIITDDNEWKQLRNDLEKFVKSHPLLSGDSSGQKEKRKKMREKLNEMRRVSFGTAFNAFCASEEHPIEHADLWPVSGQNSLSWVRNRLVHGVLRGRNQTDALSIAKSHIEWLVERCILALLGWPLDLSAVEGDSLSRLTAYKPEIWQKAQKTLFSE